MSSLLQYVEQFHLAFLDQLGRKVDKRLYALKGGCNLRFYFKSIRYSEDIDLDVWKINKDTLFKNVQQILSGVTLKNVLQNRGIEITDFSSPKQTNTTQRWKIELNINNLSGVHTKIEFSRRESTGEILFEGVDHNIIGCYQFSPILVNHYNRDTAIKQKIFALANRNVTQARDIFDLYLLLSGFVGKLQLLLENIPHEHVDAALINLQSITFQNYKSQVVAFLENDYQKQYLEQEVWELMIANIKNILQGNNV